MAVYRIWPATDGPSNADNATAVTLGTRFRLSATGWVTHLHYWRGTTSDSGTHTGVIYLVSGGTQVAGTLVTFTDVGTGWQTAALPAPIQLAADTMYVVAVHHPNGGPAFTSAYWTSGPGSAGITNGILTAPNSATASGQGVFVAGSTLTHPTNTFNGNNYWSDLTVSDTDPGALTATAADTLGITDTAATVLDAHRSAADPIGLTDAAQTALDALRTGTDTVGLTDTATASLGFDRTAGDAVGLTDQATALVDFGRTPVETVGISDAATALLDAERAATDLVNLTDDANTALDAARGIGDSLGITDTVTAVLTPAGQVDPDWDFRIGPPTTGWRVGPPRT